MKVGIITFHASHNYGSMLQAYALQQTVLSLGHQCEIINLRLPVQRKIYRPFFMEPRMIKKLKALRFPRLAIDDVRKHRLFEKFLREKYVLTPQEYTSYEELKAADLDFDCYISGSDQIWNTNCEDFSTAYYLDFVKSGKRIAYAPSMGSVPEQINHSYDKFIVEQLSKYEAISVREAGTANRIKEANYKDVSVTVDPTLLISSTDWSALAGSLPIIEGNYILVYTPWYESYKELYIQTARLAETHNLTVVCTLTDGYNRWRRNHNFKYYTAVGPVEFLNLIKFSRYVLCGSFHAVVFSLLFRKPFYAYKGMSDSRISQILQIAKLESLANLSYSIPNIDYDAVEDSINDYIADSRLFLKNALQCHQ